MSATRPLRRVIDTPRKLQQLSEYLQDFDVIAFDCETSSPSGDGLARDRFMIGYSIAVKDNNKWIGWYIPIRHKAVKDLFHVEPDNAPVDQAIQLIKDLAGKRLIIHNVNFEYNTFHNENIDPTLYLYDDTFCLAWLLDPSRQGGNGLKHMVKIKVNYLMKDFKTTFGNQDPSLTPISKAAPYAIDDVIQMGLLYDVLWTEIEKTPMMRVYQELYRETLTNSCDMSIYGIKVDTNQLKSLEKTWIQEANAIDEWFRSKLRMHEVILTSPKWVNDHLIKRLSLFPILPNMARGKSGQISVGEPSLKRWASGEGDTRKIGVACANKLLRYRMIKKLINAYTKTLVASADSRGFCHPRFNVMGTRTGRWNCSDPNLQTIPSRSEEGRRIRACFISEPRKVVIGADYSQIEYRLLAHFTQSEPLIDAYMNGQDLHRRTAAIVYNKSIEHVTDQERSRAKGVNFGIIYGQGPAALGEALGMTEQEAKKFLKRYFKVIPGVKEWMELYKRGARRHGYTETLLGRRRYLPDLSSERFGLRGAAERRVINTRIQGSAADITNLAIRDLFRAKARGEFPADIQLMIHDEVIVTCHEDDAQRVADKMVSIMEGVVQLSIPLVVEANIGRNLKETK